MLLFIDIKRSETFVHIKINYSMYRTSCMSKKIMSVEKINMYKIMEKYVKIEGLLERVILKNLPFNTKNYKVSNMDVNAPLLRHRPKKIPYGTIVKNPIYVKLDHREYINHYERLGY